MDSAKQEHFKSLTSVAIVAPIWLQNALIVLLHSAPDLKLVACTATVQVLLALDLEQIPEIILLEADKRSERVQEQISRLKATWPASKVIAVLEHSSQETPARLAGADEVLLKGTRPDPLMLAIRRFRPAAEDISTEPPEEDGYLPEGSCQ